MRLSVLQLNMNGDNFWGAFTQHIEKNDYDIIQLQELTGNHTVFGNLNSKRDVYAEIEKKFGDRYNSEVILTDRLSLNKDAYFGNAILYKKNFTLVTKRFIFLHKNVAAFPSDAKSFEGLGRGLLHLTLRHSGVTFSTMTTHAAWAKTPNEEIHQSKQASILFNYLDSVKKPFILTGDFNLSPDQPTIQHLTKILHSGIEVGKITNTLNLRNHRARDQFPHGVVVDYIFTSKDIEIKKCTVLAQEDLSDHLGIVAEIDIA